MNPQMVPMPVDKQLPAEKPVPVMRMTPKIVAYHPSFLVNDGEKYVAIEVDLNDWFNDKDVLQKLSELYKVQTAGELVQTLQNDLPLVAQSAEKVKAAVEKGILGVRITQMSPEAITDAPWWRTPPQALVSLDRNRLKLAWDEPLDKQE